MRIELVDLQDGRREFANIYQPEQLDLGDERVTLRGPTAVSGRVRQAGTEVFVTGHIDTCAQVDCDRCLKPIQLPVGTDFSLEYITESEYESSSNAELSEEAMSVSVFDGQAIDVDEIVKEQILLSVPTRSLCKSDCQ